jgi:glucokinase
MAVDNDMKTKYILAADIGGTSIECGLFDWDGNLVNAKTLLTDEVLIRSDFAECLAEEMKRRMLEQGIQIEDVSCVGLGVPGLVDPKNGTVLSAPSLKWNRYPLGERMRDLLDVPVFVGNDVNTGLLGERVKGSLQEVKDAVYFMVGTSIGAGLLLNGQIYEGWQHSAGEAGFLVTDEFVMREGFVPARPGYGYLSTQAGGYGMAHKYFLETGVEGLTVEELIKLAGRGDSIAVQILDEAVSHIGVALINMTAILNPEVILLGGGVGSQLEPFLKKLNGMLEKYALVKPEVRISSMQNRSVLYGAFALCRKRFDAE